MLERIFKFLILLVIMAAIPFVWWWSIKSASFKTILMSSGTSLFLFGLCYKLMGNWDLIPDWIPLLGGLDDSFAWFAIIGGIAIGGGSFLL